jgi:outer membrane protein TolC
MKMYLLMAVMLPGILGGCAAYQARPLDMHAELLHQIPHLTVDIPQILLPKSETYQFNPDDGLDMTEVAILAVVNNPDLKLARDDAKIARAQAFDAGLLPNPQLSAGLDFPTSTAPGSSYTATNWGLNFDFTALLTRNTGREAAEKNVHKADLVLLWQEWQVISQARVLFSKTDYQNRHLQVLTAYRKILSDRYDHVRQAFRDGNATLDAAGADLAALMDMDCQIGDLERQNHQTHYELTCLLGLSSDVTLNLVGDVTLSDIDEKRINAMLEQLAYRRPDLLALKAGYENQDLKYRQAIIRQFPALGIGVTRASDTSNVQTFGPSITLMLPLFNHHEGKIAIEKASRKRLYDEFENRLSSARSAIAQIVNDQRLLEMQLKMVGSAILSLKDASNNAEKAYSTGNIDEMTYVTLYSRLLDKTLEQIRLEQTAVGQRIALQTLLGSDSCMVFDNKRNP